MATAFVAQDKQNKGFVTEFLIDTVMSSLELTALDGAEQRMAFTRKTMADGVPVLVKTQQDPRCCSRVRWDSWFEQ